MQAIRLYLITCVFAFFKHKVHFFVTAFALVLIYFNANCQIKIEGTITDKSKNTIPGINVILSNKNQNNIIAYALSDENGYYRLSCVSQSDSLQITLMSLDYKQEVHIIQANTHTINFELEAQPIDLGEFLVTAPSVEQTGDTISYLVSSYESKNDRVIEDVLKKLPGIEVSESGKITYQGKDINKFYIENMDLLQGRYGIATKNISLKDIAIVEVYENHQPIKALSNTVLSDKAAINLKLKEDSKGIVSLMTQLGIGFAPFLWDNELILLYFSKKLQNITTYKGNNSGNDIIQELSAFYSDAEALLYEGRLLSVLSPVTPSINKQRYLFNNTHSVSSNILVAPRKDNQLTANIVYYNDRQTKESFFRSIYYIDDNNSLNIEEAINSEAIVNHLGTTIKWESNKENFYLNNAFNLNASWINDNGVTTTLDTIDQNLKTNSYNLTNTFELIKNISGQNSIRFYSFNGYARTPQNLIIKSNIYTDFMDEDLSQLCQQTTFNDFLSKTGASFYITKNRLTQSYWGGCDISIQTLNSQLQALPIDETPSSLTPDSLKNDLDWQKFKFFIQANYTYKLWRKWQVELLLPLSYNILLINDKIQDNQSQTNRILFNPSLTISYDLAQNWRIKANYSFYNYLGNIQDSYSGYIMRNYRSLIRNDGQLADNKSNACFLRMSYRNILQALFANVDLFYEQYISNMLIDYSYSGILQIQNTIPRSITSNTVGIGGNISKNISSWRTTISLSGNCYYLSSSQMVQDKLIDYQYINYGLRPRIEAQICSWAGLSYTFFWNDSKNVFINSNSQIIRSITNYLKVYFYPIGNLEINAGYENYFNNVISEGKYKSFADLGICYRLKWADFSLTWSNIFNIDQYITATYTGLDEFVNIYEIRPSQILLRVKFKLF
ncbi:carboxypeptidase-like regulatory domain-containing protein [Bacteroidales bacterium OttesenSCG-928-K22]|nr:carboxypeptidase-like regulatory domain-containing protein [Bacteroidales bacterium OttesenSCG-928-L14]MDL2240205.1 carboxypeptidase-like regulatory domain-containing protein [Bacteroidales bacterium OttesenSCG-928-K22]